MDRKTRCVSHERFITVVVAMLDRGMKVVCSEALLLDGCLGRILI